VGYQHPYGAAVQHRKDVGGRRLRHADKPGGAHGTGRQQSDINGAAVERGVLFVDHDEVEPDTTEDLDRMASGRFDESPDQVLTADKAMAKCFRGRFGPRHRLSHPCLFRLKKQRIE
jgi:hypothetical protein